MTTRCAFKIEDPSRGPGRVDFTAPGEGFGLQGTPKPKIRRDSSPKKGNLICGSPLYIKLLNNFVTGSGAPQTSSEASSPGPDSAPKNGNEVSRQSRTMSGSTKSKNDPNPINL